MQCIDTTLVMHKSRSKNDRVAWHVLTHAAVYILIEDLVFRDW